MYDVGTTIDNHRRPTYVVAEEEARKAKLKPHMLREREGLEMAAFAPGCPSRLSVLAQRDWGRCRRMSLHTICSLECITVLRVLLYRAF